MYQFDVKVVNNNNKSNIEIVAYWYIFKINTIAPGGKFIHKHPRGSNVTFYAKYTFFYKKCVNLPSKYWILIIKVILKLMHINSCSKLIPFRKGVSPYIDTPGGQMLCFMQNIRFLQNNVPIWRQIGTLFCKKRIFCIKHNIWPPGVSMYGLTPLRNGINFEQLLICINFNMTFIINIQYFEGKLTHFL